MVVYHLGSIRQLTSTGWATACVDDNHCWFAPGEKDEVICIDILK